MSDYAEVLDDDLDELEESGKAVEAPVAKIAAPRRASMFPQGAEGDGGDSIWLTSYADLMTLIACFFILMVAFANFDPESFARKAQEMAKHFNGEKQILTEEEQDPLTQLKAELEENSTLQEKASVKMTMDGLVINFSGSALFDSGSANLKAEVRDALDIMIDLVQEKAKDSRILVEGHTDDTPLINSSKYRNNWELSGARASRVVERFEDFGFEPTSLVAVGYGSTRPLKPNHDDSGLAIWENMKENRRVVIKIMKAPSKMKREKIGLGVYLDDNKILDSSAKQKPTSNKDVEVEVNGEMTDPNPPLPVDR